MNNNLDLESIENKEIEVNDLHTLIKMIADKNFTILHVNIRSLNANFEKLQVYIKSMKIRPDIIVCTESWNIKCINYYKLEDYNMYYKIAKLINLIV